MLFRSWDDVCGAVRNVDKDCLLIICYGGGQIGTGLNGNDYDVGCRTARKYNGIFHNTCYESPADGPAPLLYSYSRRWNFLHDCEFAGSPAFYPLHQRGMFNILKFGPAGYCWVTSYNDGIHPSFPCLRPVAQELETANAVGKSLGALQSMSLYLCNLGSIRWQPVLDGAVLASKLGLVPDILTDRAFLGEKVTLDPASSPIFVDYGASVLTAEAADAMAAYVRNGGKLLLFPSSGCYTAGNPGERFRLMKSLGFNTAEKLPQPGKVQNATGKNFHLLLSATVSLTEIPRHAKTLAAFPGGEPALVSWRCDRGEVFLMGGSPNLNDAGTLKSFEKWFAEIGLASRISTTNGIMSYAREKNGTLYAVVLNPTGECVTGRLSVKGAVYSRLVTNMIDGTCLGTKTISDLREGIPITLAPYETTAFRMTKPGTPSGEIYDYDYPHRSSNGETPHIVEGKLELPFEAGVDGAHTVFLSTDGTGETALSCSIDQKELKPMDGYPSIFRCPDIPRGRHVLTIEAPRRTVINEIRFQPELRPLGSWLITGPVANPDGYRGNSFYAASVPQNANWTKVEDHEGVLDFGAIYPFDARQLAFAKCEIGVPRDSVLRFDCGVDYSMLLYVNGESVFDSNQVHHSSDPSDFGLNIPLKKGDNTLLVKAGAGSMGWKVFLKAGFITEQKSTH